MRMIPVLWITEAANLWVNGVAKLWVSAQATL